MTTVEFDTEASYDQVTIGSTIFEGVGGPEDVQMQAGDTLIWTSDDAVTMSGWTLCAAPPPTPPTPLQPPLPPITPNGKIMQMPRIDITFAIMPVEAALVENQDQSLAPAGRAFARAIHVLAGCDSSASCEVRLSTVYAPSPPSAPARVATGRLLQDVSSGDANSNNDSYNDYMATPTQFVSHVVGHITWKGVNRTAACPPPPPKLPGVIDLTPSAVACTYETSADSGNVASAEAANALLSNLASAQTSLRQAGLPTLFELISAPNTVLRLINLDVVMSPLPPPSPAAPPPPPSPPSPPSPPPGKCTDLCSDRSRIGNGVCEDGGPGSDGRSFCALGTDCMDCGVRIYCTNCPQECKLRNEGLPPELEHTACFESDYHTNEISRQCTPNCNIRECDYDGRDCSWTQIRAVCTAARDTGEQMDMPPTTGVTHLQALGMEPVYLNASVSSSSRPLVPVSLQIDFNPIRLFIHDTYKEMNAFLELSYTLQWEDERLFRHPCYGALENMLSMSSDVGRSDNARSQKQEVIDQYWVRKLDAENLAPGFDVLDEESDLRLSRSREWQYGVTPGSDASSTTCEFCVTRSAEVEVETVQSRFDFFFYPFDAQVLRFRFVVEEAHIFTCDGEDIFHPMLPMERAVDLEDRLLPFTKEWKLAKGRQFSARLFHPTEDGAKRWDKCDLELVISRNYITFLIKSMVTTIVVVFGSMLTALLLHPEENMGDRCAVLFIAFLILVTNMQMDLGLGSLTQLLWLDVFNIIQCCTVLLALGESIAVHYLLKTQHNITAIAIDKVLAITIPLVLYPLITFATILLGMEQQSLCPDDRLCGLGAGDSLFRTYSDEGGLATNRNQAALIALLGTALVIFISIYLIVKRFYRVKSEQIVSIRKLLALANTPFDDVGGDGEAREKQLGEHLKAWGEAAKRVFECYDIDGGGSIDVGELRGMVTAMYPRADGALMRAAMAKAREYGDSGDELDLGAFQDAIAALMEYMTARANFGEEGAMPVVIPERRSRLSFSSSEDKPSAKEGGIKGVRFRKVPKAFLTPAATVGQGLQRSVEKSMEIVEKSVEILVHSTVDQGKGKTVMDEMAKRSRRVAQELPAGDDKHDDKHDDKPTEAPKAEMTSSVVVIKTSDGGFMVDQVSGSNVPDDIEDEMLNVCAGDRVLASSVVVKLLNRGFTVAAVTSMGSNEVVYNLVGQTVAQRPDRRQLPQELGPWL